MNGHGQVEAEALVAIVLVVIFFIAVSVVVFLRNTEKDFLEQQAGSLADCHSVGTAITHFSSTEGIGEIFIQTTHDLNVSETLIYAEGFSCDFFGQMQPVNLLAGTVRVFEDESGVHVENA